MKKFLPKVKFLLASPEEDAKTLAMFCSPMVTGWDWSNQVYKAHPKLKEMVNGSKNIKFIHKQCLSYSKDFWKNKRDELKKIKIKYQTEWNKINNEILSTLSDHFETAWPKGKPRLRAFISICPVYPRNLQKMHFNVSCEGNLKLLKQVASHEILHFLYFKKWKEVFPKTPVKKMDAPYLVWKLSEIVDPIILNEHPKLKKLLGGNCMNYSLFDAVKIGNRTINSYFERIYITHLKVNETFEQFLMKIWKAALDKKEIIERV